MDSQKSLPSPGSQKSLPSPGRSPGCGEAFALTLLFSLIAACGWPRPATAQGDRSPIPEFTGERVYCSGVPDEFAPLREDLTRIERSSPQTYYVVVVRSTGPDRKSTRAYLEKMIDQWDSQARRRMISFDHARSVIILLAIDNKQIIVLGGEELQERFGFRDPYIERELLQPHFFPYAKSKDYLRGLRVLVPQIERWIGERDQALARRREEAATREARLKGDAEAALAGANRLLGETRKELEARKADGLQVGPLESRTRQAAGDLDTATRRLDSSSGEALVLAQQAQRELQGVVDQLRRVSAHQSQVDEKLRNTATLLGKGLEALETASHAGLAVAPVQAGLDAAGKQIEQARQALRSDPDRAEALAAQADRGLHDTLDLAGKLPDLRRQADQAAKAVATLEPSARTALDRARTAGISVADLQDDWVQAGKLLATARASAGTDDRQALESFDHARTFLNRVRDQSTSRLGKYRVITRTIPLIVFGIISLSAFGVVSFLWLRKRHLREVVDRRFKEFREQSVALMDRLDALRQRHKTLTATDPDFTCPLAGATLALHNEVETDLNQLWERWLGIMEVWDRAQKLVRAGSGLAVKEMADAQALLEKEGNVDELLQQCRSCEERLDRLNQGHEQVRDSLKAARDEVSRLRPAIDELAASGLAVAPYEKEIANVDGLLAQAGTLIPADPIGAGEVVARSRQTLAAVNERTGEVLARLGDARAARKAIDEVAARAAELRSHFVHLTEDQADPDPRLDQARRHQAAAMEALQAADPVSAAQSLDLARAAIEQAGNGIDRHLRARETVQKELPARLDAARRLRQAVDQTASVVDVLRSGFAAESWDDVAGNLDQARTLLQSVEDQRSRAEAESSDPAQNYLHAAATLAQTARDQAQAEQLLHAVVERHRSLADLARQCRELVDGLESEVRRAGSFLDENSKAIGSEVRRSFEQLKKADRELVDLIDRRPQNWPEIHRRIEAVRQGCAVALKQAQEDVDGFRRLSQKLDLVQRKARDVGILLKREQKDRQPANQRYRAAIEALGEFERPPGSPSHDWDRLLGRLDEIEGNLDRARSLAEEDISLAQTAIAEIDEADRAIRSARAFYEAGVTSDVSHAESELARARGALATQAYEQAIDMANAAERLAQDALQAANHEARLRRMRIERGSASVGNGASDALIIAAGQAAGRWTSPTDVPNRPAPPAASNAPGQWTGGADQGRWTDGADQAGW